jgi:hypothetical protein
VCAATLTVADLGRLWRVTPDLSLCVLAPEHRLDTAPRSRHPLALGIVVTSRSSGKDF